MRCESCGTGFEPKHRRGRFCSGRCRVAAWRQREREEARAPLERVLRVLVARAEELVVAVEEAKAALVGRHTRS